MAQGSAGSYGSLTTSHPQGIHHWAEGKTEHGQDRQPFEARENWQAMPPRIMLPVV